MGCSQMFSFDKAQRVPPPVPLLFTIRVLAKRPTALQMFPPKKRSARQTGHAQQSGVKSVWVLLWKRNPNKPTNSHTHTRARAHIYDHIYTYTRTKYMASNVESRQLNKWHFLLCFFFSWYRHNQTLCSSSTLVWVRYNEYNIPPFFFRQLFTLRCKIDQRSKTLTSLLFETIWRAMCSFATTAYKEKVHSKHFKLLKCHCRLTSSPWFSFLSPAPARLHCMDFTQYAIVTLIILFFISLQ